MGNIVGHIFGGFSNQKIDLQRIGDNILGRGSFGVVYKGKLAGQDVAVKVLNRHHNQEYWKRLENETITFDKSLKHDNIINVLTYEDKSPDSPEVWIAMELCSDNLGNYLNKEEDDLTDLDILDILFQCSQGLAFLHENHLVHGDIKPDNVLINEGKEGVDVKVTDFSLIKDMSGITESEETSVHGNSRWLAPEFFDSQGRRLKKININGEVLQKVDVFSFGLIILFTCLTRTGRMHWGETSAIGVDIKQGKCVLDYVENLWKSVHLKYTRTPLLRRMMHLDPVQRPSMDEVKDLLEAKISLLSSSPSLNHVTSQFLDIFAQAYIGISDDNHIFLGYGKGLYLFQLEKGKYRQVWKKSQPSEVDVEDRKHASCHSLITRHCRGVNKVTYCWDYDLQTHHEHEVGSGRILVSVFPPHTMVYKLTTVHGYQLSVHNETDGKTMNIIPPAGIKLTNGSLSVCQHTTERWIAVSESTTLSIFSEEGKYLHHINLDWKVGVYNAITCTEDHIIVRKYGSLFINIYTWSGKCLKHLDMREELKPHPTLKNIHNRILSIGVGDGNTLHIVMGSTKNKCATSLHAFNIH